MLLTPSFKIKPNPDYFLKRNHTGSQCSKMKNKTEAQLSCQKHHLLCLSCALQEAPSNGCFNPDLHLEDSPDPSQNTKEVGLRMLRLWRDFRQISKDTHSCAGCQFLLQKSKMPRNLPCTEPAPASLSPNLPDNQQPLPWTPPPAPPPAGSALLGKGIKESQASYNSSAVTGSG